MWVLVVVALTSHVAFSVPGYSSEQTCSAKAKEVVADLSKKRGGKWNFFCVKPE